jgi:hypothetical protein
MAHYVVRVEGPPEAADGGARMELSVTSDDGTHRQVAWVHVASAEPDAETWGVAVLYAVEQIEVSFRGETWGVQVEGAAPMLIDVTENTAAHLADGSAERAPLEVGGIVGAFEL